MIAQVADNVGRSFALLEPPRHVTHVGIDMLEEQSVGSAQVVQTCFAQLRSAEAVLGALPVADGPNMALAATLPLNVGSGFGNESSVAQPLETALKTSAPPNAMLMGRTSNSHLLSSLTLAGMWSGFARAAAALRS
jgi:hypothetical protein